MTISDTAEIHPTAIVADGARIGAGTTVGPYSVIGAHVRIGEGSRIGAHVVIEGQTRLGDACQVFPFAALGTPPQDVKFQGEVTELHIGNKVLIREHVTMNPGTDGGGGVTSVDDGCFFLVGAHVAHDCKIGRNVIFVNNATVAGHVQVGDFAVLGGLCAVHQFVRIGAHAMIGGMSGVERDVIPFGSVIGNRAHLAGLNVVGMKRRGFERAQIHALRAAFRSVFESEDGSLQERAHQIAASLEDAGPAREMIDFILAGGSRHFCVPTA